jgi:DNA-binding NarL/FixJ family response regulator
MRYRAERPVRVLLADDSARVRRDIRDLLHSDAIAVVAEAATGDQAVSLARSEKPDVVLLDVAMPTLNGIEAARLIRDESLGTRVVLMSTDREEHDVVSALAAGARGFVAKIDVGEELISAIKEILTGRIYLSSAVAGLVHSR